MKTLSVVQKTTANLPEPCHECGEDFKFFVRVEGKLIRLCPLCLDKAAETLRKAFSKWFKESH